MTARAPRLLAAVAACLALAAAVAVVGANAGGRGDGPSQERHGGRKSACALFKIGGQVDERVRLRVDDLRSLPAQTVTVSFSSGSGSQTHTYTGPLLTDVLALAKPSLDPDVKNDALRFYASAIGSDGYAAIVSFGEIDAGFGARQVLLAYDEDGTDLCEAGPRLVVPGDIKGGRYVSNVVRVQVGRARGDD